MVMMTKEKYELAYLRAELHLKQWAIAERAGINQATYSDMEAGRRPVRRHTALKVFLAINAFRGEKGLPALRFDDIAWNIAP